MRCLWRLEGWRGTFPCCWCWETGHCLGRGSLRPFLWTCRCPARAALGMRAARAKPQMPVHAWRVLQRDTVDRYTSSPVACGWAESSAALAHTCAGDAGSLSGAAAASPVLSNTSAMIVLRACGWCSLPAAALVNSPKQPLTLLFCAVCSLHAVTVAHTKCFRGLVRHF